MEQKVFNTLAWRDDFDLNLIIFSMISAIFAVGSFFLESTLGTMFVYSLFVLCVTLYFNNVIVRFVTDRLEVKENLEEVLPFFLSDYEMQRYSLGASSFCVAIWCLSVLYHFSGLGGWYWILNIVFGGLLFLALLGVYAAIADEQHVGKIKELI